MKSIVLLISSAIAAAYCSKLVSIPFTAVDRKGIKAAGWGRKKLGALVDVPLENVDLAYLIDINIGTCLGANAAAESNIMCAGRYSSAAVYIAPRHWVVQHLGAYPGLRPLLRLSQAFFSALKFLDIHYRQHGI